MSVSNSQFSRVCAHCGETFYVECPSVSQRFCGHTCYVQNRKRPLEERFWEKVNKNGPIPAHRPDLGPCWEWLGAPMPNGYGRVFIARVDGGRRIDEYAHRFSYELLVAPIPEGLVIDHCCRNRRCVNPTHLEPVTQRENALRGDHPGIMVFHSGRCGRGHERTPENGFSNRTNGYWHCRVCDTENARRRRGARKAQK